MNFLAHIALAEPTPASLVGNVLGDFVKGTPGSLAPHFPAEIIRGICQHRAIDAFTDSHPTFAEARDLLAPARRRFAGIVVDVFYDHILANHWPDGLASCRAFIERSYQTIADHSQWHSPEFAAAFPRMRANDWLGSPITLDGLTLTFRRIASRNAHLAPIIGATGDFLANEQAYRNLFKSFWPELQAYSESWLAQ